MPNQVLTVFTADAKELFQTADLVDARLAKVGKSPVAAAQNPLVQEQKAVTQAVASESAKRIEAEKATTRAVIAETEKRVAAKKAEAAQIAAIPISNYRNLAENQSVTSATTPFTSGKTAAQLLFESGSPASRVNAGANSLQRLAGFEKQILQQETADRLAGLKAQETGFSQYFRNLKALRAEDVAETVATNRIETESTVRAAELQTVARRSSFVARDNLAIPLAGGLTSRIGVVGSVAIGAAAALAAIKLGADAAEAFNKANNRDLALRATIEGTGQDFRRLSADAQDFAVRHVQDITKINDKYVEFTKLSKSSGKSVEEVGQAVIDIQSKRHLSDEQVVQGLKNIREGTADANLLGDAGATVFLEYAQAHHQVGIELTQNQKIQATTNELLKQGGLAAGDAQAHMTGVTSATTKLSNAWDGLNVTIGTYIDYFIKHPKELALAGFDPGFIPQSSFSNEPDPKLQGDAAAAKAAAIEQNRAAFQRAAGPHPSAENYQQNVLDFALSRYVNQADFLGDDPDKASKAKKDAVDAATQVINAQVKAIMTGFTISGGNVGELQRLKGQLNLEKNFIDPDKFKELTDQADKAIQNGFKNMVDTVKENVPKLRQLYQQVLQSDVPLDEKGSILKSITEQIKRDIDDGTRRVKELADGYRAALQGVFTRGSAQNPFIQFFSDADDRVRKLTASMKGLDAATRNLILRRNSDQDQLDLAGLRFTSRTNALNLRDEAGQFQRFEQTGSTDSEEVSRIKQTIRERGPDDALYGDFFKKQLADAQRRDIQTRLDQQINIAKQSFLSGPLANSPAAKALFNQEIIKLTPLNEVGQFSRSELDQAISSRQQESQRQTQLEQTAIQDKQKRDEIQGRIDQVVNKLWETVVNGNGLPIDLKGQAITVVEVTSPKLSVSKRSSKSTTKKSTADAMDPH